VRALLTADRNQQFQRMRMSEEQRQQTPEVNYQPFIIADADTGHGGDAHVRNLIRRFVEAGVTGYHIEDQKPGTKKCGHQGGKVLVGTDEQIKRLNAARLQLDVMRVGGLIVARTDAEAASLIESVADERDQAFVLGATNLKVPSYKQVFLAFQSELAAIGADVHGHELYNVAEADKAKAIAWLEKAGITAAIKQQEEALCSKQNDLFEPAYAALNKQLASTWEAAAGVDTYGEAVAKNLEKDDHKAADAFRTFAQVASFAQIKQHAKELQADVEWNCELPRTPEGYYQIKGGIPFAIARSLAVAPYADLLWMETKTADLADAREFAEAIHTIFPDKMLAYNLSPSFNWDTTGMTEQEMREFPAELGKLGFVFNFITYGGHQIDGLASDEFSSSLQTEGMLALAKVQRKLRLLDSPYKTPQSHVGGPRLDAALASSSGRTATTQAMGKGSTQFQHLKHTELPTSVLEQWLAVCGKIHSLPTELKVQLKPYKPASPVLELQVTAAGEVVGNVVFEPVEDRRGRVILSIRDQNVFPQQLRRKRMMTLMHLYLLNRYSAHTIHYLTPTPDNLAQCEGMQQLGLLNEVSSEIGQLVVAQVNTVQVSKAAEDDICTSILGEQSKGAAAIA
jgi:isocitrate lyase